MICRMCAISTGNAVREQSPFGFLLKAGRYPPEKINGYRHEAATHMSVAAAVQKGNADTGMGVYSTAKALNLAFIDIACEEYDFITYKSFLR